MFPALLATTAALFSALPGPPSGGPPSGGAPPVAPPDAGKIDLAADASAPAGAERSVGPRAPARPRFDLALGMGLSFDDNGLLRSRTKAVPAFHLAGSIGDGPVGLTVRLFASQAAGRYQETDPASGRADQPVDRLAVDLLLAARPLDPRWAGGARGAGWSARMLRTVTLTAGPAGEHVSAGPRSAFRWGLTVGASIDVPLFIEDDDDGGAGPLRLRLALRRMFGAEKQVGTEPVRDSKAELLAALAAVF